MNRTQRARINRQNASRSTGPKTDEGKAASRANALKHGLRAETIALPGEDPVELQAALDRWADCYGPETPGEEALVERAALATVQLRRCARFHASAVGKQVREAEERWHERREDELERLRVALIEDPVAVRPRLVRTSHGCLYLIERWERLDALLVEAGHWCPADRDEAIRLLGARPDRLKEHPGAYLTRLFNLMSFDDPAEDAVAYLLHPNQMPDAFRSKYGPDWLPDQDDSRRLLREMIADAVGPLRAEEERLRLTLDDPDCAGASDRALLLGGPEGSLLIRYEKMHEASFHRAYKAILQAQKEADARDDDADVPATGDLPAPEAPAPGPVAEAHAPASAPAPNEANPALKPSVTLFLPVVCGEETGVVPGPDAASTPVRRLVATVPDGASAVV